MKKVITILAALLMMSCANENDYVEIRYQYSQDDYKTMYEFIQNIYESDLFGIEMPVAPTYEEMMQIAAPIVMTDVFGDTLAEGDCEKEYRLMLAYFNFMEPDAEITRYLDFIITNQMY